jgi:putative component of membrane protein insertase Oxa1/YidC/SpoIIIJ protein YidD
MKKISLIFGTIAFAFSASGQIFTEHVDGNTYKSSISFYSNILKKKEPPVTDYIDFYQKYISGIRGQECPMYPSCSNFGIKTFNETNFVAAFVLTSDRLLRCGHDRNNYSLTLRPNGFKFIDYPSYDTPPEELFYSYNSYFFAYSDTAKDDSALMFIKKLINNGYYQAALLEIMRIEFQSPFNIELFINKIICLKAIGEYEKALFDFETKCPEEQKQNPELLLQIALIEYKLQNFERALIKDTIALKFCNDPFLKPKLISLQGLIYANLYEWQKSISCFLSLSSFESYQQISAANSALAIKALQIKNKSPTIAGMLSIIPGAGYAYTGHKQTSISALFVNGLLAYATYSNFKKENYGMAALTGVFSLSFYVANIYGSVKSAKRYNEQQKKNIISKLEFNSKQLTN